MHRGIVIESVCFGGSASQRHKLLFIFKKKKKKKTFAYAGVSGEGVLRDEL